MNLKKAIEIKQKYQYILQDASFSELIEADNLSIEAIKYIDLWRQGGVISRGFRLPGETED